MRSSRDSLGFTLVELLTVVVLIGILASLAAPAMAGMLNRMRIQGALRQLTGDIYYARMLAVRSGTSVVVRFPAAARCPAGSGGGFGSDRYVVLVRETPVRVAKTVVLGTDPGVCLEMNQSDSIRFDSRGLPRGAGNRRVVAHRSGARDSIILSRVGRIVRSY